MWILTRDAADNALLAAALHARGVGAWDLPLIERIVHPWPMLNTDIVMLTSRICARFVPENAQVATLIESTAPELAKRGITPVLTASGGVVALASAVAERFAGRSVLYVHSAQAVGRPEHVQALVIVRARCELVTHALYDLRLPEAALSQWQARAPSNYGVFFASPSAVENFFVLWHQHAQALPSRVACLGRSTLAEWRTRRPADFPDAFLTPTGDASIIAKALS